MIGGNQYNPKTEMGQATSEIWLLELYKSDYAWKKLDAEGIFPQRYQHASCYVVDKDRKWNYIFVHGGFYDSFVRFLTTHKLHFSNEQYQPSDLKWELPIKEEEKFNVLPEKENWENYQPIVVDSKQIQPTPRGRHTATYINGKVYLIGGHGGSLYARLYYDEVWTFDCTTNKYEKIIPVGKFNERAGHSANLMHDGTSILIYGGWNNKV